MAELWPFNEIQDGGRRHLVQVSDGSGGYHHYRTLNTAARGLLAHDLKGTSLLYDSPNLFLPTAQTGLCSSFQVRLRGGNSLDFRERGYTSRSVP